MVYRGVRQVDCGSTHLRKSGAGTGEHHGRFRQGYGSLVWWFVVLRGVLAAFVFDVMPPLSAYFVRGFLCLLDFAVRR